MTQAEIDTLIRLEELIWQRWRIYDKMAAGLVARLLAGATVEQGPHTARLRRIGGGGQRGVWLVLNRRRSLIAVQFIRSR